MVDYLKELPEEDLRAIRDALLQHREEGVSNPLIPIDADVNGDGIADSFGLDENDQVVIVHGVELKKTVFESVGGE